MVLYMMSFSNQKYKLEVLSVVGARPNFMKLSSISNSIDKHNFSGKPPFIKHVIVHTGQHFDEHMSSLFFEELSLPRPHFNLEVGSGSHAVQTAEIMRRFEPVLMKEQPDILIVVGDVNSTIAGTLVASKIQYNGVVPRSRPIIAHVEAGLRSFDRSMPEEINRILTDALSDLLFVTEEDAITNLQREGIPKEKIHFVGNVMIDTLIDHLEKAKHLNVLASLGLETLGKSGYGLLTLHRPCNVDSLQNLKSLTQCIASISRRIPIIFPVHPRTKSNLQRFNLWHKLEQRKSILLTKPLGYLKFLNLLSSASLVLTDSGGIQEETTFLGVPCLTLRENTERPATVRQGTNYLLGTDQNKIIKTAERVLMGQGKKGIIPRFWDGNSGLRIINTLIASNNPNLNL
jgi:UDP-N-acetylglucosamine 2-epimerase (non-hydrolysing)